MSSIAQSNCLNIEGNHNLGYRKIHVYHNNILIFVNCIDKQFRDLRYTSVKMMDYYIHWSWNLQNNTGYIL